jgi:hypothetical protein
MFNSPRAARKSVYDSFPPNDGRLSDAFAEAHRTLAVFETVRDLDTLAAFNTSVFALRATLNLGGNKNPNYDIHYSRALALDETRRAYLAQLG